MADHPAGLTKQHDCLIAFGSNEGNSRDIYESALELIRRTAGVSLIAHSQPVETSPVGGPEQQHDYLNAAIRLQTEHDPQTLHQRLVGIETELGRIRRQRWGSRKIDLDLLLYDQIELKTETLVIPHPRMSFRRFVLGPAREIADEMVHPTSGLSIGELAANLDQRDDLIIAIFDASFAKLLVDLEREVSLSRPRWKFKSVRHSEQLKRLGTSAKLVAFFVGQDGESNSVVIDANSYRGATLELPRNGPEARAEILAAIDATG